MHGPDVSTPVVLLRSVGVAGLGITRSLGSMGVPVYSVESSAFTPASHSRYTRGWFDWSLDDHQPEETVAFLVTIAKKLGRAPVLLPTRDQAAIFLAENHADLAPWFKFPKQCPELVHSLCDKKVMQGLARKYGVPVPDTRYSASRMDVIDFAVTAKFPVMLKAIDGDRMFKLSKKRMFIVNTPEELIRTYDEINDPQNVMVQDYIPGPEENCWIFHGYFNEESECLASFTGRKLRQCRAYAGDTCLAVHEKNSTIEEIAVPFLKAIGFRGVVDMCVRYDARDHTYRFLDVNPRIGANSRVFVDPNGLDLARMYYLDITGQSFAAEPVQEGRKWLVEDYDLVSSIRYWRDGNLTFRQWFSSLKGVDEFGYLHLRDPLPAFARLADDVIEIVRRFRGRRSTSSPVAATEQAIAKANSKAA